MKKRKVVRRMKAKRTVRKAKSKKPFVVTDRNIHRIMNLPNGTIIHAYKVTTLKGKGPYKPRKWLTYRARQTYTAEFVDMDQNENCAAGLHLATLRWCLTEWGGRIAPGKDRKYKLFLAETVKDDLTCVPFDTDGKFRVRQLRLLKTVKVTKGDEERAVNQKNAQDYAH